MKIDDIKQAVYDAQCAVIQEIIGGNFEVVKLSTHELIIHLTKFNENLSLWIGNLDIAISTYEQGNTNLVLPAFKVKRIVYEHDHDVIKQLSVYYEDMLDTIKSKILPSDVAGKIETLKSQLQNLEKLI
jgi:hypothetical protein